MDRLAPHPELPSALNREAPARRAADLAGMPPAPAAVVVVPVPLGQAEALRWVLASLARSRTAGGLPAAPGSLAVLILAAEPAALSIAEAMAPDYPFPLRVEPGPGDAVMAVRQAGHWAASLGAPGVPVLIADRGEPLAPRWAYELLCALRDGADLVTRRASLWERLLMAPVPPQALSGRAQWAMEHWHSSLAGRRGAAWTEGDSPWRRPSRSGLRAVAA